MDNWTQQDHSKSFLSLQLSFSSIQKASLGRNEVTDFLKDHHNNHYRKRHQVPLVLWDYRLVSLKASGDKGSKKRGIQFTGSFTYCGGCVCVKSIMSPRVGAKDTVVNRTVLFAAFVGLPAQWQTGK